MSKAVNEKWKKTFPDTIGNQNRPATGVDDTQPFETGAFPQYMANDPVRYDLQNAAMSQSMSNDARLKEMVDARGKELDDHKVDPGAHKTGIAGNAATATKVVTNAAAGESANIAEASMAGNDVARIRVSGASNAGELALETADDGTEPIVARQYTGVFKDVARTASILDANGNTSFPGTVVAPKFTGALNGNAATASKLASPRTISLTGKAAGSTSFDGSANAAINVTSVNADTATKLSTARKINITGNATGAASFDGSGDISINTTVNESAHAATADKVTADKNGVDIADNYVKKYIYTGEDLNNVKIGGLYGNPLSVAATTAKHYPANEAGSLLVINNGANGVDGCSQIYTTYSSHDSYKREYDAAAKTWSSWRKYAFEDSTVAAASALNIDTYRPADANVQHGDGKIRYFLVTSSMSKNKPPTGDGQIINLAWDNNGGFDAQLYVNNTTGRLNMRGQNGGKWSNWLIGLDSGNFNDYAPTKTGGGASGTWPISISGNADTVDGYHASDLLGKITAANTGGIVAASLTENGYVKFANGLLLQWGKTEPIYADKLVKVYFPISFSNKVFHISIKTISNRTTNNTYGDATFSSDFTNTYFTLNTDPAYNSREKDISYWLAVGY